MTGARRSALDRLAGGLGRRLPTSIREMPPLREIRRRRRVRARHPVAAELLRGRHAPASRETSILYYTVHRCASSFVGGVLEELGRAAGLPLVDLDSYFFQLTGRSVDEELLRHPRRRRRVLDPTGYIFGPLRRFDFLPDNLEEFRVLLVVRDPRDVLTSLYFAMAFSHSLPAGVARRSFQRERERARRQGLEAFVRERSGRLAETYGRCCDLIAGGHPHLTLLRYEEMVGTFESWLERLVAGCGLAVPAELMRGLATRADFTTAGEDPERRKRQVEPGDHRRKLSAQAIAELDLRLAPVLDALGYSGPGSSRG